MKTLLFVILLWGGILYGFAQKPAPLPDSIYVGGQQMHVQGIALDKQRKHMYFSFTNKLVKTDLNGNILGSVDQLEGHLGAIALNPKDGRIYASLECKSDEIGTSIAQKMGTKAITKANSIFYIAIFDGEKISHEGMNPQNDSVMTTICVQDAVRDYQAIVQNQGKKREHRYGCSGIDGVMFAPMIGNTSDDQSYLYVGYGIYGDTTRTDNDYQVLLCYHPDSLKAYERAVKWGEIHTNGPKQPLKKLFLKTGNSTYGIQNMTYDASSHRCILAVYPGKKSTYPNYSHFSFDIMQPPVWNQLDGMDPIEYQWTVPLESNNNNVKERNLEGWNFPWGSTGICPIGNGYFYISENHRNEQGEESCTARRYKWTGDYQNPFTMHD